MAGVDTGVDDVDVDAGARRLIVSVSERESARVLVSELRRLANALKTPGRIGPRASQREPVCPSLAPNDPLTG